MQRRAETARGNNGDKPIRCPAAAAEPGLGHMLDVRCRSKGVRARQQPRSSTGGHTACVRDWAGNSAGGEPSPTPARPLHERPVQEGMFCAANEFTGQIRARKCVVGSPRHVWTRTRRRGSGTDTGTPARLSWHRKPSSPGPSGAHLRCRDSARPRDVCEPAAGTACARRAPGSELWDRLTHPRPRCPHESPCARTIAALWPTELHAPRHRRRFRVSFSPSREKWRPLPESAGRIGPKLSLSRTKILLRIALWTLRVLGPCACRARSCGRAGSYGRCFRALLTPPPALGDCARRDRIDRARR